MFFSFHQFSLNKSFKYHPDKSGLSSITVSVFYPHCFTFPFFFVNTNFIKYNSRAADRSFLESLDSTDKCNTYITKKAICGWETEISTLLWQYSFWTLHNLIVNWHSTTKNKTFSSCNVCVIKVWYFSWENKKLLFKIRRLWRVFYKGTFGSVDTFRCKG